MNQQTLLLLLSFLVSFQLLFIGVFLVSHRKGKRRSNILLGSIFLLMSWNFGDMTLTLSPLHFNLGFFHFIDDGFILLYGPLFYLYIQLVIFKNYQIPQRYGFHFIPFLFMTIAILISNQTGMIRSFDSISSSGLPVVTQILGLAIYVHVLIYLGSGYRSLSRYRKAIMNQYSRIDNINLNWLSFALKTMVILTLISMVNNFFVLSGAQFVYSISIFLLLLFLIYFVNRVILKALKQPEIFAGIDRSDIVKYSGSSLTAEKAEVYKNNLTRILEVEKLYRNPQLSLAELAGRLNLSPKALSQVINQSFNQSFFDYINSYRIREAQEILESNEEEKLTVLEVMYDVGFNSKSSFNTAFKKATGQTPTEFRKNR